MYLFSCCCCCCRCCCCPCSAATAPGPSPSPPPSPRNPPSCCQPSPSRRAAGAAGTCESRRLPVRTSRQPFLSFPILTNHSSPKPYPFNHAPVSHRRWTLVADQSVRAGPHPAHELVVDADSQAAALLRARKGRYQDQGPQEREREAGQGRVSWPCRHGTESGVDGGPGARARRRRGSRAGFGIVATGRRRRRRRRVGAVGEELDPRRVTDRAVEGLHACVWHRRGRRYINQNLIFAGLVIQEHVKNTKQKTPWSGGGGPVDMTYPVRTLY